MTTPPALTWTPSVARTLATREDWGGFRPTLPSKYPTDVLDYTLLWDGWERLEGQTISGGLVRVEAASGLRIVAQNLDTATGVHSVLLADGIAGKWTVSYSIMFSGGRQLTVEADLGVENQYIPIVDPLQDPAGNALTLNNGEPLF